jgi:hypothetical protein
VAALSSNVRRACLRQIHRSAKNRGVPLRDALLDFQGERFDSLKTGSFVTSSSGNNYSATVQAVVGNVSPEEMLDLSERLLSAFDESKAELISDGTAEPTDDAIELQMLASDDFQGVTRTYDDFSLLRIG